jgi:hypothetical protein
MKRDSPKLESARTILRLAEPDDISAIISILANSIPMQICSPLPNPINANGYFLSLA